VIFSLHERKQEDITLQVMVKDSGIGIPRDKQESIFQTFTQVDESVTRKYGGTGLGLSIVKNLVHQMGGEVKVTSPADTVKNCGTVFAFTLKLKTLAVAVQTGSTSNTKDQLTFNQALRVLVVDDNHINLLVARKLLERLGAEVTTALNGREAIDIAMNKPFDLIMMDIQMPGLNGYESTIELRRLNYTRPIIALSANAYKEDVDKSMESGMNGHMQKPFTETELHQKVTEALKAKI
jgi:CheY-like chemotaxis protein